MKTDLYIGIMTGTSMDAIDVVIARFNEFPKIVCEFSAPLNPELRQILMNLASDNEVQIELLARTHFVLAQEYANAVQSSLKKAKVGAKDIRAIGLHGQTIRHLPKPEKIAASLPETGATIQLGSGAALAALTGIDVISDFRSGDIALGGEGAPLVPMFDYHFFKSETTNRILLNIGGIANLSFIPAGGDEKSVIAFDTGPGNMIIDYLATELLGLPLDKGGSIAKNGKIDKSMLNKLLADKYFEKPPPKSTGRELFSGKYSAKLKQKVIRGSLLVPDALATATELTARSIYRSIRFLPKSKLKKYPTEIIASGGGAKNRYLCKLIQELLPEIPLKISDEIGIPSQAKEALAFAWFAKAFIEDEMIHLPKTTGAKKKIILGSLSKGSMSF